MQQQELAQMRQRDANLTALAAIGPRKKRKVDSPGPGSGTEVQQHVGLEGWRGLEAPGGSHTWVVRLMEQDGSHLLGGYFTFKSTYL